MKAMGSAKEYYTPPQKGKYPATITAVEPGFSKKGESHLKVTVELADGPGKGETQDKWIGTDGTTKYGAAGKPFLRGLGLNVDSDAEIPDEEIARRILGLKVFVEIDHEPQMEKDEQGNYTKPRTYFDPKSGQTIQLYRWLVKGFQMVNTGAQMQAPAQTFAPPQQMQAPVQFAPPQQIPQGAYAQAPQGFPQQGYAPQGFVPQQAPQQFAQPPNFPQGFAPPPGFQPGQVAQPGWQVPPNGAQQAAAPAPEATEGKKGKGRKIVDAD